VLPPYRYELATFSAFRTTARNRDEVVRSLQEYRAGSASVCGTDPLQVLEHLLRGDDIPVLASGSVYAPVYESLA
jgi:hypothetical protein